MLQLRSFHSLRTNLAAVTLLAQACSSQWKEQLKTPVAIPMQFSQSGSVTTQGPWWGVFEDDQLKGLMAQGMAGNLGLKAAQECLKAARAIAGWDMICLWLV
ncbi:hypothetical protein [Pseudobacteriovorax antillogorgiicola]|uniref:Uncharacterized protein n=1 Tax=Pseudobacteriovorax antillogorgiicola TaxID=1513793 RepID=A0A1Y6BHS2_9BACT|nr:hypothetical protein [Pseudobacteriovorax antillogorgiicola]TCS55462.1 hypothetical protein EDD56_105183 [Pseudobacteriovorax antillogorgiicola]SMF12176.1 hypothetical protein SAMN06296036_105141 [Pseudobacteriovorax antillogorgiicola]